MQCTHGCEYKPNTCIAVSLRALKIKYKTENPLSIHTIPWSKRVTNKPLSGVV